MFQLTDVQLRELSPLLDDASSEDGSVVDDTPAPAVWVELIYAARAAVAAHPECPCCKGYGEVTMFQASGDPDPDPEERPCPVCRPWPLGFSGWRNQLKQGRWVVPPYGAGERPSEHRGQPLTLAWDDSGRPVQAPSEF